MVNEQEYLKALEVVNKYNSENKKKAGRKKEIFFTKEQKTKYVFEIFEHWSSRGYSALIYDIGLVFKIGISNSKKMIIELQKEGYIFQNGKRGNYFIK